jgi:hypothetical protein
MTHLHFSPFQFATAAQLAEPKKQVVKERKHLVRAYTERKAQTRDLGCTMSCTEAHEISSLPNAFISPNKPDVMRQSKSVFGSFMC